MSVFLCCRLLLLHLHCIRVHFFDYCCLISCCCRLVSCCCFLCCRLVSCCCFLYCRLLCCCCCFPCCLLYCRLLCCSCFCCRRLLSCCCFCCRRLLLSCLVDHISATCWQHGTGWRITRAPHCNICGAHNCTTYDTAINQEHQQLLIRALAWLFGLLSALTYNPRSNFWCLGSTRPPTVCASVSIGARAVEPFEFGQRLVSRNLFLIFNGFLLAQVFYILESLLGRHFHQ